MNEPVSLVALAAGFLKIALASFGGGLSAWARVVVVEERKWLGDEEFLSALTLCRVLPGPNQVNMAVFVGTQLRGMPGALAALLGLLGVPLLIIVGLGVAYFHYHHVPQLQSVLGGAVAAATGMALSMGFKVGGPLLHDPVALALAVAAFVAVGLLHWSLVAVVVVLGGFGMWWYWPRDAADA
ncbi:MAG TPA: chromate transporter [Candidatus Binatia bacterium]|jgi:chromate transporter|nr:chromate transporter [Candidatus Binatia bacterium]